MSLTDIHILLIISLIFRLGSSWLVAWLSSKDGGGYGGEYYVIGQGYYSARYDDKDEQLSAAAAASVLLHRVLLWFTYIAVIRYPSYSTSPYRLTIIVHPINVADARSIKHRASKHRADAHPRVLAAAEASNMNAPTSVRICFSPWLNLHELSFIMSTATAVLLVTVDST